MGGVVSEQAGGRPEAVIVQIRGFDRGLWERVQLEAIRRKWKTAALVEAALKRYLNGSEGVA